MTVDNNGISVTILEPKLCPNGHVVYYRDCTNFKKKKGFNCSNEECMYFERIVY